MKKTALEWLVENLDLKIDFFELQRLMKIFEQAKEMEKQQIVDAYADGRISVITKKIIPYEQYYTETFKKK